MTNALIEELQAGPGSRELSDKVLAALSWEWPGGYQQDLNATRPDPTRNLQDVVDLVPEGWAWEVKKTNLASSPVGIGFAAMACPWNDLNKRPWWCSGKTPALALVTALIKARSL